MAKKEMKFEEAMGALEQIVRQLESGNVPLDEALDKFKEGMELSQFCNENIDKSRRNRSCNDYSECRRKRGIVIW